MSLVQTAPSLAKSTCFPCRRSKRRCDRSLPICQLCIRKGTGYSYPTHRGQRQPSSRETAWNIVPTPDDSETNSSPPPQAEQVSSGSNSPSSIVTAIRFMAPDVFREAQLETSRLNTVIPSDVAAYVGDSNQIRDMAITFFSSSASWMPIICRKQFFGTVLNHCPLHALSLFCYSCA